MLVALLVAVAAQFVAEHYGAPAMLMALLFGIALNFLGQEGRAVPGIVFSSRHLLRVGVALMGARISVGLLADLGAPVIAMLILGILLTIAAGILLGRLLKQDQDFAVLSAGAVAICGASAAIAISAVQPRTERSEQQLMFTVLGVTMLSTIAMILYPTITAAFGMSDHMAGIFLGGTIHDVAQVVGAGFSISDDAGKTATLVKLIRVSMLAPVVISMSLIYRRRGAGGAASGARLPGFVIGFAVLAAVNSLGLLPEIVKLTLQHLSGWALLIAIAAVGLRTRLDQILQLGPRAIALMVAETVFLALFVLGVCRLLG
ncbi:putative sulfate exporter family transporter [Paracoccus aurantiacus]|uniref:Putative sulfate exporter family transporter n=2 Tax=Paracoccus aurantiacus TaxID=2599412 RepID=A0A5C6SAC1_9RHOB|nr:putative sulfate exporter family transporter [Paracoccus aurantiacus]TXB71334.1 putative sulfate exporter family transporter [Paracoccus aurantiacus]